MCRAVLLPKELHHLGRAEWTGKPIHAPGHREIADSIAESFLHHSLLSQSTGEGIPDGAMNFEIALNIWPTKPCGVQLAMAMLARA